MLEQLERFHAALGLQAAVVGLALALAWRVTGACRTGGRVAVGAAVAAAALVHHGFVPAAPAVVVVALALIGRRWDRWDDSSLVGVFAVVSSIGVWAAVPDTEAPLIVAAIVTVPVVAGQVRRATSVDRLAAIVLVVVAARIGSAGRDEVIGGIGCVGLLASLPSRLPFRPPSSLPFRPPSSLPRRRHAPSTAALVVIHTALVAVASRVLTRVDRTSAVVGVVAIVAVAVVVGRTLGVTDQEDRAATTPDG